MNHKSTFGVKNVLVSCSKINYVPWKPATHNLLLAVLSPSEAIFRWDFSIPNPRCRHGQFTDFPKILPIYLSN